MDILYSVLFFLFGALLTSFYLLVGQRIPVGKTILGRSMCDRCHQTLRMIDIIPIFGYLVNKGRCSHCHQKINYCYPLYELLGGLIFMVSYLYAGFSLELIVILIMFSVFFIEAISDQKHMIVMDRVWMIGVVPLMIIRIIEGEWKTYLLSSAVLFITLFLISYIFSKIYKREALGGGDVKLYFFIGWLLTVEEGFLSLFLASILGLIYGMIKVRMKSKEFALVPFIAMGVVIAYLYGDAMIEGYLKLFGM